MRQNKKQNLLKQLYNLTKEEQVELCANLFSREKDNDGQVVLYTGFYPDGEPDWDAEDEDPMDE